MASPNTSILSQREIFELIKRMKELGLEDRIHMPRVAVFGDQSSGKSSVLEAIARIPFPTKDALCTRFPTELVMWHDPDEHDFNIEIVPSNSCDGREKERIQQIRAPDHLEIEKFGDIVEWAGQAMGLGPSQNFSEHMLRVTIVGPSVPTFALVDLPGLFHGRSLHQTEEDADRIFQMVREHMKRPRSINLAIINAEHDLSAQIITRLVNETDPLGTHTKGIITKPDTLDEKPTQLRDYLQLVGENNVLPLKLGWHVLRNKKFSEGGFSAKQRDDAEALYLSSSRWSDLPPHQRGIGSLVADISKHVREMFITEAGPLIHEVGQILHDCNVQLKSLEVDHPNSDIKTTLARFGHEFSQLVRQAVAGRYTDPFFRANHGDVELRWLIHEVMTRFDTEMRRSGHTFELVDGQPIPSTNTTPRQISRSSHMSDVGRRLQDFSNGGCQFSAKVATDLFYELSEPWEKLCRGLLGRVSETVRKCLHRMALHVGGPTMGQGLWDHVIQSNLQQLENDWRTTFARDLEEFVKQDEEIIFSQSIMGQLSTVKEREMARMVREKMVSWKESGGPLDGHGLMSFANINTDDSVIDRIADRLSTGLVLDRLPCAEVVHCSQEYYKVGLAITSQKKPPRLTGCTGSFAENLTAIQHLHIQHSSLDQIAQPVQHVDRSEPV